MSEDAVTRSTRDGAGNLLQSYSVEIENLQHYYGEGETRKQVLFDNTLKIQPGEIVIMTGPSGSGKTTLLTLIGTLRRVQEGSLKILGHELLGASNTKIVGLRKQIGFIFQAHNLFESLTAFQNVRMATELAGMDNSQVTPRINAILTRLGLGSTNPRLNRIHHKPKKLSGGQKQRVAVARGLVHTPRIVLADEPTAALDEHSGRTVVTMFQEMAQEHGTTILIVTHDNRILDVADRIVNMVDGKISSNVLVKESARICEFLKDFPAFKDLTPQSLTQVADKMSDYSYQPGETIIRQGDPGREFFIIAEGRVSVQAADGTGQREITQLKTGDYFGEIALMEDRPRNATIIAMEPTRCYVLDKDEFRQVVQSVASFEEELRKALFQRQ
jgi:putative ABC transport system ATP-binding protein